MEVQRNLFLVGIIALSLLWIGCNGVPTATPILPTATPTPLPEKVKIVSVERVNSIGEGMTRANAHAGHDILLVEIETDEDILPFGDDLVLKDDRGKRYPVAGLLSGKYIFEVPETTKDLTLVVKGTIEVLLP